MTVQLYLGDCLEIMPTLPQVDAIITDLPYGTTACSWDTVIPFEPMWKEVKRICKGVFVTTASQPFTSKLVMSNPEMFRYEWVWNKVAPSGGLSSKTQPLKSHENILVFSKNGATYNPIFYKGVKWNRAGTRKHQGFTGKNEVYANAISDTTDMKYPKTIIEISNADKTNSVHPTQKPVALYEYLIRTYTNEGDTVLDICAGSGTTGVACVQTGRNFIGIEIDPTYFAIAEKRIKDAQQQMRLDFTVEKELDYAK